MTQLLLVYRRSSGELVEWKDLGQDRSAAIKARAAREVLEKDDPDVEVIVLSTPTREVAERTHARYFGRGLREDAARRTPRA